MIEKRKHQRIRFGLQVQDASGKNVWMSDDISSGGCFLQAIEKAPIGSKSNLSFQLPGSSKYIKAVGVVRNLREKGMGVEFVAMDTDSKEYAERFVGDYIKFEEKNRKSIHPSIKTGN